MILFCVSSSSFHSPFYPSEDRGTCTGFTVKRGHKHLKWRQIYAIIMVFIEKEHYIRSKGADVKALKKKCIFRHQWIPYLICRLQLRGEGMGKEQRNLFSVFPPLLPPLVDTRRRPPQDYSGRRGGGKKMDWGRRKNGRGLLSPSPPFPVWKEEMEGSRKYTNGFLPPRSYL